MYGPSKALNKYVLSDGCASDWIRMETKGFIYNSASESIHLGNHISLSPSLFPTSLYLYLSLFLLSTFQIQWYWSSTNLSPGYGSPDLLNWIYASLTLLWQTFSSPKGGSGSVQSSCSNHRAILKT